MNIFKIKPSNGLFYSTNILFKIVHEEIPHVLVLIHYMLLFNYMIEKFNEQIPHQCFRHVLAHFAFF